jgi:uncharacterized protein (DUF362 family)
MKQPKEIISIIRVKNKSDIYENMRKGFELIGNPRFHSDDAVAIKPNLCCIKGPETGATTDPLVVEGIIKYLQEEFGVSDISIVESDGTQVLADMAFKLLGYENLSKKLNVKLVNLSKSEFSIKTFDGNTYLKKIKYPHIFENLNWLISVPKIKIHTLCFFGGTMKNQYGCNPYPKKSVYHNRLDDCLVDLTTVFKPQLVVVDGIVAMEGCGPVDGIPVKMDTLIFGRDVVAIDHLIAKLVGVNPEKVKYLIEARKRKLGTTNYQIVGINPKEIARKFKGPPKRSNFYGLICR